MMTWAKVKTVACAALGTLVVLSGVGVAIFDLVAGEAKGDTPVRGAAEADKQVTVRCTDAAGNSVTAAAVAVFWLLQWGGLFVPLMFGYLAYSNFIALQAYRFRGPW